jgi:hypothetical protein
LREIKFGFNPTRFLFVLIMMEVTAMIIDWRLLVPLRRSGWQSAYSGAIEKHNVIIEATHRSSFLL